MGWFVSFSGVREQAGPQPTGALSVLCMSKLSLREETIILGSSSFFPKLLMSSLPFFHESIPQHKSNNDKTADPVIGTFI
jgi:hypothetical protein